MAGPACARPALPEPLPWRTVHVQLNDPLQIELVGMPPSGACAVAQASAATYAQVQTQCSRAPSLRPPARPLQEGDKIEAFEVVQKSLRLEEAKGAVATVDMTADLQATS